MKIKLIILFITTASITYAQKRLDVITSGDSVIQQSTQGVNVGKITFKSNKYYKSDSKGYVEFDGKIKNVYRVSATGGDFTTLQSAITYVNALSGTDAVKIYIDNGTYYISDSITILSSHFITIEGAAVNGVKFYSATGITNKPFFNVYTGLDIYRCSFYSTGVTNYGTLVGENCFNIKGNYAFQNVECLIQGFKNAVNVKNGVSYFLNNSILAQCDTAVKINTTTSHSFYSIQNSYYYNNNSIYLYKSGANSTFRILTNGFFNATDDTAIIYNPTLYTYGDHPTIQGNVWDVIGGSTKGFDFTRSDGRDANIVIQGNSGFSDQIPTVYVNLTGGVASQNLTADTWTKVTFTASTSSNIKFKVENDKVTYLSSNIRNANAWGSGEFQCTTFPATIQLKLVKNGNTTVDYGLVNCTMNVNNEIMRWAANAKLIDVKKDDYFEVYAKAVGANETIVFQNFNWLIDAK